MRAGWNGYYGCWLGGSFPSRISTSTSIANAAAARGRGSGGTGSSLNASGSGGSARDSDVGCGAVVREGEDLEVARSCLGSDVRGGGWFLVAEEAVVEAPLGQGGGVVVCGEGVEEGGEGKWVCCGGWEEEESGGVC